MSESLEDEDPPKKRKLLPIILGVVLALVGAGGGFFAVSSGLLFGTSEEIETSESSDGYDDHDDEYADEAEQTEDNVETTFLPLERVTISLPPDAFHRHLIFTAHLEVTADHLEEITAVKPRILDVLNSYLRLVTIDQLNDPAYLLQIRSQMLHRIKVVAGFDAVHDLLIIEFLLN